MKKLNAPDGTPTEMIHTFMTMLYRVLHEYEPDCTVIAFDAGGKTFRHELLQDYKAGRKKPDDGFRIQLPLLQDLLKFHGYKILSRHCIEADDIIASLAKTAQAQGYKIFILTSDKDFFQLLSSGINILRMVSKGVKEAELYDTAKFFEEFHFMPSSFPDYLAILGDSVDKIPGIKGIGEQGAKKLIEKFPTLEKIFENLDSVDKLYRKKLENSGLEKTVWTRDNLIKFRYDVFNDDKNILDECVNFQPDYESALNLAGRLGLRRIVEHINKISGIETPDEENLKKSVFVYETKNSEDENAEPAAPECDFITKDYKSELRTAPEKFADNPKIWDFKTAYYMMHPDAGEKKIKNILEEITTQDVLNEFSAELENEILAHENLHDVMTDIDLPLIPVLNKMEDRGVRLEPEKFSKVQNELEGKIIELESAIMEITGVNINLKSPKQVSWLLFERLRIQRTQPFSKNFQNSPKVKSRNSFSNTAN